MNIFSIPLGLPFLKILAIHLLKQYDAYTLARAIVYLPTRQACRTFRKVLFHEAGNKALLKPRVIPLNELEETEIALTSLKGCQFIADLPDAMPPARRVLILASLIQRVRTGLQQDISFSDAISIAHYLGNLIDEFHREELPLTQLERLKPSGKAADHWTTLLDFLKILSHHWPAILQENKVMDSTERHNSIVLFQAAEWETCPPSYPIIIAGSMGTISSTDHLIKVVSMLPQGQVILPGLQQGLDDLLLPEYHPQFSLYSLLKRLKISSHAVKNIPNEKDLFMNRSSMFANSFDETSLKEDQSISSVLIENFLYAQCVHAQEELDIICLYAREGLQQGKKIACIVPHSTLAKRLHIELTKWGVQVSSAFQQPFKETLWGSFFCLTAAYFAEEFSYLNLLNILKHPLSQKFHKDAHFFERHILRNPSFSSPSHDLSVLLESALLSSDFKEFIKWFFERHSTISSFICLHEYVKCHQQVLEKLLSFSGESLEIYLKNHPEHGEFFANFWQNLTNFASSQKILMDNYEEFFKAFTDTLKIKHSSGGDSDIEILTPREARFVIADRLILADMNEGAWPTQDAPDPFFSMAMRQSIGLPSLEKRHGQSAHDFLQLCSIKEVLITRSLMVEGAATLPSPFLSLLLSYLKEKGQILPEPTTIKGWAKLLNTTYQKQPIPHRPLPCPPVEMRPQRLSVTEIETLIKDPYSIYAKHVLKLRPLKSLTAPTDALNFGLLVHQFMETWVKEKYYLHLKSPLITDKIFSLGQHLFSLYFAEAPYKAFWEAKFKRIVTWLMTLPTTYFGDPILTEVWGQATLGNFTLFAKADRIDSTPEGAVLIDYKTGHTPLDSHLEKQEFVQLPLEAVILQQGNFSGLSARVKALSFWSLGGTEGGHIRFYKGNLEELIESTRQGMQQLLEAYQLPTTPYVALGGSEIYPGPYDHLARVQEWKRYG